MLKCRTMQKRLLMLGISISARRPHRDNIDEPERPLEGQVRDPRRQLQIHQRRNPPRETLEQRLHRQRQQLCRWRRRRWRDYLVQTQCEEAAGADEGESDDGSHRAAKDRRGVAYEDRPRGKSLHLLIDEHGWSIQKLNQAHQAYRLFTCNLVK